MSCNRGVRQVPEVDGSIAIICRTSSGAVRRKVILPSDLPDAAIAWEIQIAERWLNRIDPPLRLVRGAADSE
jgi:ABC-type nitrate/sulfonate/bicarbonate transport system permease component